MSTFLPFVEVTIDLQPFNTLALPSRAPELLTLRSLADVEAAHATKGVSARAHVLGGGSNVVLAPELEAPVWRMAIPGIQLVAATDSHWVIKAGAGERWHTLVEHSVREGWGGLENLALIPGTVGAAPVQNIGAYGVELAEFVAEVLAFDREEGRWRTFGIDECEFAYRDSIFKRTPGRWIIAELTLLLPRLWRARLDYPDLAAWPAWQQQAPTPASVCAAVCAIRRKKLPDPEVLPNAGSFFKNPILPRSSVTGHSRLVGAPRWAMADGDVKLPAGWLIEAAGWKGKRLGPVGMHDRHALVLVNHGGATGEHVRQLAWAVQHDVQQQFGVMLEPEPVWLGFA